MRSQKEKGKHAQITAAPSHALSGFTTTYVAIDGPCGEGEAARWTCEQAAAESQPSLRTAVKAAREKPTWDVYVCVIL